jgi:hypothetical protein
LSGDQNGYPAAERPKLISGDDIEDQFTNAVKLALETRDAVKPSPVAAITEPVQKRPRKRRLGQWHIALLYMALTATVAIIVVAALLK